MAVEVPSSKFQVPTEKRKWERELALSVADGLSEFLRPHCEPDRICFAGSLRRGKALVGDVEILYVPKIGAVQKPGEMFESEGSLADRMIEELLLCRKIEKRWNKNGIFTWGAANKLATHRATGVPVDFFATTKEFWWMSLVIRTGPADLNIRLAQSARARGLALNAYAAFTELSTGNVVVPKSEREVFELAGVPWAEPEERN